MTLTSHMIMIHQAPAHWRCTMLTSWQRRVVSLSAVSSTEWEHLGSSTRAMMMLQVTWVFMIKPWHSSGSRTTSGASMETVTRSHCLERVQVSHGIMVMASWSVSSVKCCLRCWQCLHAPHLSSVKTHCQESSSSVRSYQCTLEQPEAGEEQADQ